MPGYCGKCGRDFTNSDIDFCTICGVKLVPGPFCSKCGTKIEGRRQIYCGSCGNQVGYDYMNPPELSSKEKFHCYMEVIGPILLIFGVALLFGLVITLIAVL